MPANVDSDIRLQGVRESLCSIRVARILAAPDTTDPASDCG